jgi:hypothetical protein
MVLIAGWLLAVSAAPATAQNRIDQARADSSRDSTAVAAQPDSTQQRVNAAAAAVMAALDSLAAQSADTSQRPAPSPTPRAQRSAPSNPPGTITIDGLVMDETQTKIGRDFYDVFYSHWEAPPDAHNFTITVKEQPMPSLGTRVVVELNSQTVFQTRLQPRYAYIEQAAKRAVYMTWRQLQRGQPRQKIY